MAALYTNNWINNTEKIPDASVRAAEKAHRQEERKLRMGWRWIKVSKSTQVLVPCNKQGQPTEEGLKILEGTKKLCI
jgi:hypothetical protein